MHMLQKLICKKQYEKLVYKHLGRKSTQGRLHLSYKAPNATDRREHPDWVRCTLQAKMKRSMGKENTITSHLDWML